MDQYVLTMFIYAHINICNVKIKIRWMQNQNEHNKRRFRSWLLLAAPRQVLKEKVMLFVGILEPEIERRSLIKTREFSIHSHVVNKHPKEEVHQTETHAHMDRLFLIP